LGNVTDIPSNLLTPDSATKFLEFLNSLPLTNRRRVELIAEWTKITKTTIPQLTAAMFDIYYNV